MTTAPPETRPSQLHQVVAKVGGVKARTEGALTTAYHAIQKPALFAGFARTYRPKDDEGDQLPPESTLAQLRASDLVNDVGAALSEMLDIVATQDTANTRAKADLVVDGEVLLTDVPVTYLMWLEKEVVRLRAFIAKLPTLDLAEQWEWNEDANAWATPPTESVKPKKVRKNHVLAPATQHHKEQVEVFTEDVIIGYWTTVKFSGGLHARDVAAMQRRINTLVDAIRDARETANAISVVNVRAGDPIVRYLFADVAR